MHAIPWVLRGTCRSTVQEASQKAWLETSAVIAKDDLVATRAGKFCPTLEVGGENHLFQQHDDEGKRAARALSLVQMGVLSAARQGAPVAPNNMATLRALADPPLPREELSRAISEAQPTEQLRT